MIDNAMECGETVKLGKSIQLIGAQIVVDVMRQVLLVEDRVAGTLALKNGGNLRKAC